MADLDPDALNKLKVVDLREHLSNRGLPTAGLKAELVKRLRTALLNEEQTTRNSDDSQPFEADTEGEEEPESKAEEDSRLKAEEEAQQRVEEEARQRADEEDRQRAEEEDRQRAEEEDRQRAEEEARQRAEEEAKLKVEQEAIKKAEEERIQKLVEERKRKEEEEQRIINEKLAAEEERKRLAEEQRIKRLAEEAEKKRIEEERIREEQRILDEQLAAEKEGQRLAEEERMKRIAEEAEKQRIEEERAREELRIMNERRAAEEERQRLAEEAEKKRVEEERAQEEQRIMNERRAAEEERMKRLAEEAEEKRIEEERVREEQRIMNVKRAAEEERKRLIEEQIIKRQAEEAEKNRIEEERVREVRRKQDEEEMRREQERWLVEEQMRKAQEDHKKRIKAEEEKRKLELLERQKKIAEAEEQQKQLAEEQRRKTEEQRLLAEEEERKKKEQEILQMSLKSDNSAQNDQLSFSNVVSAGLPVTLQIPPAPPFSSMQSVNIIPPPPTVLMSNIPPLLPPGTSLPPTTMQNISAPSSIFPPPMPPPVNIMTPPLSSALIQNDQDSLLNVMQQNNLSEFENNNDMTESMDIMENSAEIKLPQALEKVLALKSERAQLLGVDPDSVLQPLPVSEEKIPTSKPSVVTLVSVDEDEYAEEEDSSAKRKESKSRRRKKKKKKRQPKHQDTSDKAKHSEKLSHKDSGIDVDIEYVQEVMDISDPLYTQFMKIFEKFKLTESEKENEETAADSLKNAAKEEMFNPMALRKKPIDLDDDDDDDEKDDDRLEEEKPKLSKRKLKKLSRMTVAELKQKVNRPELVEMHDVTAKDPVLLLHLKASRNTVPVPRHWCFKRKYLQGKRGIEKPAFELPDFIKRTGIMEMRQALQEKEDQKTMKAKMRERVRPKLGKIDIDYQKLHDAFFKWQTKPKMTIHGDLYYEGKEFETRLKEKKPGDLSEDLRTALGMPTGPNANKCPPPWLIAMQRYGPPPSYPNLKIPGLNAPIPDGCSFGYHAGGWGKPPVDETGRPLYGDVFGTQISDNQPHIQEEEIDHTLWGELESESSEEEEEDEEEEEEDEEEKTEDETGLVTPAEGLITPSGFSSIPAGMETPDMIELRKRKIEAEMEGGETPALYTILPEKKTERVGAAMMGSTHIYDLAAAIPGSKLKAPGTASVPPQGIEVALDPSELEMDTAAMAARYEQTMREQQSQLEKEDLSDMVAEHAARQKNKRKKQQLDSAKPPKKYKEFKF